MEKVGDSQREKILIVGDTRFNRALAADTLAHAGYITTEVAEGARVFEVSNLESPDLIILDGMTAGLDALEICRRLKADPFKNHIPILLFVNENFTDKVLLLRSGADGFLTKPYAPEELTANVEALLRRSYDNDPLTKLPSAPYVHRNVDARLTHNLPTGAVYFDIDRFKVYNFAYGHEAGNRVLVTLARLAIESLPAQHAFVGHLGSDDFLAIMTPEVVETFAQTLLERFREARGRFYRQSDLERGYIVVQDRPGGRIESKLLALSIAIGTNEYRALVNYVQVSDVLSEVMRYIKSRGGDQWARDRRTRLSG